MFTLVLLQNISSNVLTHLIYILSLKVHRVNFKSSQIDSQAIKVIKTLHKQGFDAYLVGGCVRDLLLDKNPKDFDIVSNATPEQIKAFFKRSRIIGKRFRLVHIIFGRYDYLEVSTFRSGKVLASEKRHNLGNKIYGSIEQDAKRRDFSINALYYDIFDKHILDYSGGFDDIQTKTLKMIGTSDERYQEDPVRLLRAVRFAVKLDLEIPKKEIEKIKQYAHLLKEVPSARLYEESLKLFHNEYANNIFNRLIKYNLFFYLFPYTKSNAFIMLSLENTAQRIKNNLRISNAFFLSVFLWQPFQNNLKNLDKSQANNQTLCFEIAQETIITQLQYTSFAKYITRQIIDIWLLQNDLKKCVDKISKKSIAKILIHPRFRAAYDFLLLRSQSIDPQLKAVEKFWKKIQK